MTRHHDFGDIARGQVIDAVKWSEESRVRPVEPARVASGRVTCIYVLAPDIVGIYTPAGDALTIRVTS